MINDKGVNFDTDFMAAVLIAFFLFWASSGWYRVDCALGVAKACELIAAEKDYSEVSQ